MSCSEGEVKDEVTDVPPHSQPWEILYRVPGTSAPIANLRLPPLGQAWPLPFPTILSCLFAFQTADSALEQGGATPKALWVLPLPPAMSQINCIGIAPFQPEQALSLLILGPVFPTVVAVWPWKDKSGLCILGAAEAPGLYLRDDIHVGSALNQGPSPFQMVFPGGKDGVGMS